MTEVERELKKLESNYRLHDPSTHEAEVRRILTEELSAAGLKPKPREAHSALKQRIFAAADKFMQAHPPTDPANPFVPCKANEEKMLDWIFSNGMDGTSPSHYELAYPEVRNSLEMPAKRIARKAPTAQVIDGLSITPTNVNALSARDMERRMQNPRFVAAVNALEAR